MDWITYLLGILFMACWATATWRAIGRPWLSLRRLYWIGSALLMWGGIIGAATTLWQPPLHYTADGQLSGEMPPEFGLSIECALAGAALTAAGLLVSLIQKVRCLG